jgi:hypothetical protein
LKAVLLQATTIDYHLGIASLRYNGLPILEFPIIGRGDGATRFIPVQLGFLAGLEFQQGDRFEMFVDPPNTCGQKYEMVVFGTETDLGGGGGEYSFGNP